MNPDDDGQKTGSTHGMTDRCDVDGCENRAHTFIEKGDDSIEGMIYCEQHFREVFFGETDE